jgi:hypothetical protein
MVQKAKGAKSAPAVKPTITLQEKRERVVGLSLTLSHLERLNTCQKCIVMKVKESALALHIFEIGLREFERTHGLRDQERLAS